MFTFTLKEKEKVEVFENDNSQIIYCGDSDMMLEFIDYRTDEEIWEEEIKVVEMLTSLFREIKIDIEIKAAQQRKKTAEEIAFRQLEEKTRKRKLAKERLQKIVKEEMEKKPQKKIYNLDTKSYYFVENVTREGTLKFN